MKIKNILISQPDPGDKRTVYHDLADKYKLNITFRPFIQVEAVGAREVRLQKVRILDHEAVIFTSRNAVDHYFRVVDEMRLVLPITMKYFCPNEGVSHYIQKYIPLRKRKVFIGKGDTKSFFELLKKHKNLNYLFPCSNIRKDEIPDFLDANNIAYKEACMYETVNADLSDLSDVYYDILVFFSPQDIVSLYANFPDFTQDERAVAGWGVTTAQAIEEAGLMNTIPAPTSESPSMVAAIENFIKANK